MKISDNYKKHFDVLLKILKKDCYIKNDIDELSKEQLEEIIQNYNRCDDWKEQKLYAIGHYYKSIENNENYYYFFNLGKEYTKKLNEKEKHNLQSENEKKYFMSYVELNELKKFYSDYKNNLELMNRFLLLSMLTDQPPLRTSTYYTMKLIIDNENNIILDKKTNYIFVRNDNANYSGYYYIQNDKHSNNTHIKKKRAQNNDENDEGKIEISHVLAENIYKSYFIKQRENMFYSINNYHDMISLLRRTTKNEGLTFNMCRSAYKNHFHIIHNKNTSVLEKELLAKQMRHSTSTAEINYYKVDVINDYDIDKLTQKAKILIEEINKDVNNELFDNKDIEKKILMKKYKERKSELVRSQKYKETDDYKKLRYNIIRNANLKNKKIGEKYIEFYGIKHDGEKYL